MRRLSNLRDGAMAVGLAVFAIPYYLIQLLLLQLFWAWLAAVGFALGGPVVLALVLLSGDFKSVPELVGLWALCALFSVVGPIAMAALRSRRGA